MKAQRKNLAAFTIMIGVLTLTVSALAEKAHGDHLPERNGRGTAGVIITSGLPAGILLLLSAVSGSRSHEPTQNQYWQHTAAQLLPLYNRDTYFAVQWPMRLQSAMTSVYH